MSAEDVVEGHPLKLLDEKACLPENELSLIIARSGVGKSAALINFALEQLIAGKQVLHFCAEMTSEKVHQYYQEIFEELARVAPAAAGDVAWNDVFNHFTVISYADAERMVDDLDNEIQTLLSSAQVKPALVVVDGLGVDDRASEELAKLKRAAAHCQVKILAAMLIHRNNHGDVDLETPLSAAKGAAERVFYLEPASRDRINLDFISSDAPVTLPVYLCPHDLIFKVA